MIDPKPPASFGTRVVSTVPKRPLPRLIFSGITSVTLTGAEM